MKLFSIRENNRLLLPVFISLYVVFQFITSTSLELNAFPKRMIGIATLEKVDISMRVGLLKGSIARFLSVFLLVLAFVNYLSRKKYLGVSTLQLLNTIAVGGLFLLFFAVFGIAVKGSFSFIFFLFILICFGQMISYVTKSNEYTIDWYLLLTSFSFSTYFLLMELAHYFISTETYIPLHPYLLSTCCVMLLFAQWFHRKNILPIDKLAYLFRPFLWLPALSVISNELYLIFNNYGIYEIRPLTIYFTCFLVLLVRLAWLIKKYHKPLSIELTIRKHNLPALVVGLGVFTFYEPFLYVRDELFELGNPALGIQRFFRYGELPLFETFNSHLFAELFYGFIYTFINGFNGVEYNIYYFLNRVIYGLVCYYFFRKALNNHYASFVLVIFMVFMTTLLPRSFYLAIPAIFVLDNWYNSNSKKYNYLFFITLYFLILWRIDIGFANLIALLGTAVIVHTANTLPERPAELLPLLKKMMKAGLAVTAVLIAIAASVVLIKGVPVFHNAEKALHYLTSTQTYGYLEIIPQNLAKKEWHYFIFPVAIALFFILMLFGGLRNKLHSDKRFSVISVLYLTLFYFANLQRGIVRHGLTEGSDEVHTSFGYLILAFIPYLLFVKLKPNERILAFVLTATLIISAFRYGGVGAEKSYYQLLGEKVEKHQHVQAQANRIERARFPEGFAEKHFKEFKSFMDHHFPDSATFIDFSNTPMLYFYADKRVPSYFNQNLLSIHDEFLQYAYIRFLKQYDIPVVVYSNYPKTWYDAVDGVPNEVRHYLIAEHIFRNYHPAGILDKHTIWLRNGLDKKIERLFNDQRSREYAYSHLNKVDAYDLKYLPMIWGTYDEKERLPIVLYDLNNSILYSSSTEVHYSFLSAIDKSSGNYLRLILSPGHGINGMAVLSYGQEIENRGEFKFRISTDKNEYIVRLSMQYNWTAFENDYIRIKLPPGKEGGMPIRKAEMLKGD